MQIYLARNQEQAGPYSLEQVNSMLASGQVVLSDLAWHEGLDNWQPLGQLTAGRLHYSPHGASPFASAPATPTTPSHAASSAPVNLSKTSLAAAAPIASIGKRLLGAAIDVCLVMLTSIPALQYVDMSRIEQTSQSVGMLQAVAEMQASVPQNIQLLSNIILIALCALQIFLISRRGQSIGKLLSGTKIVQEDQVSPVTFNKVIWVRTVLPWVLYSIPVVNILFFTTTFIVMLLNPHRQSLHDRLAKTLVVDARPEQLSGSTAPRA